MILENLKNNRSHRSFTQKRIKIEELEKMIEGARYSASTKNSQKIRYALISDKNLCDKIFPLVKFAGSIPWNPTSNEAPTAYILLCSEKPLTNLTEQFLYFDMGLASQNILLVAQELGYGGCIIASYNKPEVDKLIELPEGYSSHIMITLGEPTDKVFITPSIDGNTLYSRDENYNHFVPKLSLEEISLVKK